MRRIFTLLLLLVAGVTLSAQSANRAVDHLQKHHATFGLEETDVRDLRVTDDYPSPDGTEHVYLAQYYRGIPVYNAQAILHFRNDRLVSKTVGLLPRLAQRDLPSAPAFSAPNAVVEAARSVAPAFGGPIHTESLDGEELFVWPAVSAEPLQARLVYLPTGKDEGDVRLAWRVLIDRHAVNADYFLVMVDALDGRVLHTDNLVLSCAFGEPHRHDLARTCEAAAPKVLTEAVTVVDGAAYNVFAFGVESPSHGRRTLEVNPADSVASPFGWHDIDGMEGPEFTFTRGNNVHAYPDRENGDQNDDSPDIETADGGSDLVFDFFYEDDADVDTLLQAAMVQSFYTSNKMHDFAYTHGFDELAGNFQRNNYKRGGQDGDDLRAEVQDGSGLNNANFFTPADGSRPRMQMMLFNNGNSSTMQVTAPANIAGPYLTGTADFGPNIAVSGPYEGEVAYATDGTNLGNEVCNPVTNGSEIDGKFALITRGNCNFEDKVFFAQQQGAIGVIICNNVAGVINMTSPRERAVTIPSLSMTREDCALLRMELDAGNKVEVKFELIQAPQRDSDFDAGIVAHEYGHGISTRLVGGPANAACLRNDEQMGEGWSDFFTLATTPLTVTDDPDGTEIRPIGTYSVAADIDARGFRTQPYSTDEAINDKTYDDVIYTGFRGAPHPVGEIWAAALWDIYWFFTNRDGFDPDLINGQGGNNRAVRLVIEGMKYTTCSPGLLDARDGILEANRIIYDGEGQCDLYQIFAGRGMGFSADQGISQDRTDNRGAGDVSPYCIGNVELKKEIDVEVIEAGELVGYTLTAFSYREEATENVVITETIPEGMTLDQSTIEGIEDFTLEGNTLTFNLGTMQFEDSIVISYDVTTNEELMSTTLFFDGLEDGDDNWEAIGTVGEEFWEPFDTLPFSGDVAWFIRNDTLAQDQSLELIEPFTISGDQPALRFFTRYRTEAGWDAGTIEISTDQENWTYVTPEKFLRGNYRGEAAPNAAEPLQSRPSFWGVSRDGDYEEIIVDLAEYVGQDIYFRFRFVADDNTAARGWWIDDVEIIDVFNYDAPAVLTSDAGDNAVATAGELGVLVTGAALIDNVTDPRLGTTTVDVFPNPAGEEANVRITSERSGAATIQLLTMEGRTVLSRQVALQPGATTTTLATGHLPAGVYAVQVLGANRVSTTKLTLR